MRNIVSGHNAIDAGCHGGGHLTEDGILILCARSINAAKYYNCISEAAQAIKGPDMSGLDYLESSEYELLSNSWKKLDLTTEHDKQFQEKCEEAIKQWSLHWHSGPRHINELSRNDWKHDTLSADEITRLKEIFHQLSRFAASRPAGAPAFVCYFRRSTGRPEIDRGEESLKPGEMLDVWSKQLLAATPQHYGRCMSQSSVDQTAITGQCYRVLVPENSTFVVVDDNELLFPPGCTFKVLEDLPSFKDPGSTMLLLDQSGVTRTRAEVAFVDLANCPSRCGTIFLR